jgi:magnesium transporter
MNFTDMPELKMEYGYPMMLATIALICCFLYWRFRKNGWL